MDIEGLIRSACNEATRLFHSGYKDIEIIKFKYKNEQVRDHVHFYIYAELTIPGRVPERFIFFRFSTIGEYTFDRGLKEFLKLIILNGILPTYSDTVRADLKDFPKDFPLSIEDAINNKLITFKK